MLGIFAKRIHMKRIFILLAFCLPMALHANPELGLQYSLFQKKKKKSSAIDKSRILFGPGIGIGAGYRSFSLNLSPSVAYCFTDKFHAGVTLGFNYFQQAEDYTNLLTGVKETYKFKFPGYTFSAYARYIAFRSLLLNFEPEISNVKYIKSYGYNPATGKLAVVSDRLTIPSVLVGVGYAQRWGTYGYSFIMVAYDLVQNPNARYYQTLDYRFGVMINLWE